MGVDKSPLPQDGESPSREVNVRPFAIDPLAVTNDWFGEFALATGYRTEAERHRLVAGIRGIRAGRSRGAGVQRRTVLVAARRGGLLEASGRAAIGPIAAGSIIPSCTCRGTTPLRSRPGPAAVCRPRRNGSSRRPAGSPSAIYPWGDEEPDDAAFTALQHLARRVSRRAIPQRTDISRTAPADAFAPNGYGLFNMVGNTWEWCADAFRVRSLARAAKERNDACPRSRRAPAERRLLPLPPLLLLPLSHRRAHRRQRRQLDGTRRLPPRLRRIALDSHRRNTRDIHAACQPRRDHVG